MTALNVLIIGGGDFARHLDRALGFMGHDVTILSKAECDATRGAVVADRMDIHRPEFVVCTAGMSDRLVGATIDEVLASNLKAPMVVGAIAHSLDVPCLLVASTAGISPGEHVWYGPAKAGVINFVRAMGNKGARIWALSPGRMDTAMRERDWPGEDPHTRLEPHRVAAVALDIIDGRYAPGANVVIRKVGLERVDVYEDAATVLPSLL